MATTDSLMNSNLTAHTDADNMEVGTSPYPLVDDIEVEFEDDDAQYADDNSMADVAPASIDPMQADVDVTQPDEHMDDEEITYEDYEMNAGENHDNAVYYESAAEIHQDTNFHEVESHKLENYHDQDDVLEASTEDLYEPELVDEERTNTQQYSSPKLDPNKDRNAEYEELNGHTEHQHHSEIVEASHGVLETTSVPQEHDFHTNSKTPITVTEFGEAEEADAANGDTVEKSVQRDQSKLLTENLEPNDSQFSLETAPGDVHVHPRSPSPAEIHPVTVDYSGTMYSLFPCRDEGLVRDVLLEDPALALLPINSLLKELHTPVADYLGHEDEIVLDIPSLGLHICEDSKYAVELTLSQVIDTYMMLSQNQALGHIEPLHCQLSHRTCLRTQMQYLVDSARGGKTYAEIVEEHLGSPDKEDHPHGEDTFEDFTTAEDDADDADDNADNSFDDKDQVVPTVLDQETHAISIDDDTAEGFAADEHSEAEQVDFHVEQDDAEVPEEEEDPQQLRDLDEHTNVVDLDQEHSADASYQVADHDPNDMPETEDLSVASDPLEDEEAEDLFADGAFNEEPTSVLETAKGEEQTTATEEKLRSSDTTQSPHVDDDELDFDLWEKEDQLQAENGNLIAPVTPSKSSASKRKVDEDEDELDLEFTPQPKKSRSS